MTPIRRLSVFSVFTLLLCSFGTVISGGSQNYRSQNLSIKISGTSSLHDWTITSEAGEMNLTFVMDGDRPTDLSALGFTIPVHSLKSGKGMMDKNTYKAMKAGDHKNITFALVSGSVTPVDAVTYHVKAIGRLTIAGTTKETELLATAKFQPSDKSFIVTGMKKMKMTDYNVSPPTAMLGTIKTGNEITIGYQSKITR